MKTNLEEKRCKYIEIRECQSATNTSIECLMCLEGGIGEQFLLFASVVDKLGPHFSMGQGAELVNCLRRFHVLQTALLKLVEKDFPKEYALLKDRIKTMTMQDQHARAYTE